MQANVTISQLWNNPSLLRFFFRQQSIDTLEELINRSIGIENTLSTLNAETEGRDLDEVEEEFYEMQVEELAEQFGIELHEEEED